MHAQKKKLQCMGVLVRELSLYDQFQNLSKNCDLFSLKNRNGSAWIQAIDLEHGLERLAW